MPVRPQPITRRLALTGTLAGTLTAALGAPIRATDAGEKTAEKAARETLQRLIGKRASNFAFSSLPRGETAPFFAVRAKGGQVRISADTTIGLTRGAYAYLKNAGAALTSWEGDRIVLPHSLPDGDIPPSPTLFAHRAYLNPCTYGYTMAFWDWNRWERELDWMALHGIDMPLAMEGQEYVFRALWAKHGLSAAELDGYFTGPAFLPWHRMGNIEGYDTPLPKGWIAKKHTLQKRLLERMRALGMTPILPAFAGYVPKAFAEKYPHANIHRMEPWGGFRETYWLDPLDPLFAPLAKEFLDLYAATYGSGTHYLADAFNEMRPPLPKDGTPTEKDDRLAAYGRALYQSIAAARPGANFVMQGWLFGIDAEFWTPAAVSAFLRDTPDDKTMVLDIVNDSYPQTWKRDKAYFGKRWIFGYIHNFGGNNPLFGDFELYRRDFDELAISPDKGRLSGFGVFPEGLNTNSSVYEYMFDRAWPAYDASLSPDEWFEGYLRARYGSVDPALLSAWSALRKATYATYNWRGGWWKGAFGAYLLCKRPSQKFNRYDGDPPDLAPLKQAVRSLGKCAPAYGSSALFRYDLIAAAVHAISLEIDSNLLTILRAMETGALAEAEQAWELARVRTVALDDLMGAQPFSLSQWVRQAADYADTPVERACYIREAKTQVTVWGGDAVLNDYASKAWQGLYRDFYLPRWQAFYEAFRASVKAGARFDEKAYTDRIVAWEWDWTKRPDIPGRRAPANPLKDACNLISQL